MNMVKRSFDFIISLMAFTVFLIPMIVIGILVKLTSKGPAVHWSKRIGKDNQIFLMPKFRTMKIEAPQIATHLMKENACNFITPIGAFLRKTSLDELPQIYSVLIGEMSLIGPRPALFNEEDLIKLRTEKGVHRLRPGITGWAQINGRDELPIPIKVQFDKEYLEQQSFRLDFKILALTVLKVFQAEGVSH